MKRIVYIVSALAMLLCTVLVGCKKEDANDSGDMLRIVATNFPLYDFARAVAGDRADITLLLPVGTESHSYEPSPKDVIKIKESDLFLYIGGTDEYWAEKLIGAQDGSEINALKLIEKVDTLTDDDGDDEIDGHIWTSTDNAKKMVSAIADAIISADPDGKDIYGENAEKYIAEIDYVGKEIADIAANAKSKMLIFGSRFPFRYFEAQFGFECYAAFPACSEESEPSAATVAGLIDKINQNGVTAVYCPELCSTKVAETLCRETGAKLLLLHSCHNVTAKEFEDGETYVSLMKKNAENLKEGLGQ